MARRSGYLLLIQDGFHKGKKAIAYHDEQRTEFKGKFFIHVVDDNFQPVMDETDQPLKFLKCAESLKVIGYTD